MNLQPKKTRKKYALVITLVMILCLCFAGTAFGVPGYVEFVSSNPMNGAINVDPGLSAITVDWDENITLVPEMERQFNDDLTLKEKVSGVDVPFTLTASGTQMSMALNASLKEDTQYQLNIPENLVRANNYGFAYENISSRMITFTTGEADAEDPVVTIDPISDLTLKFGAAESATLAVVTDPEDAAVTFESANDGIATVNTSGLVQAVAPGTTTITVNASADDYTDAAATVNVTVQKGDLTITGLPASLNLLVDGSSQQLNPAAPGAAFSYASTNAGVATVTNGLVAPVAVGNATITVTATRANYNDATAQVTVYVTTEAMEQVALTVSPLDVTLEEDATSTLSVNATEGASIAYESVDPTVATVAGGVITAVAPGSTTIKVTASLTGYLPKTVTVNVTVTEAEPGELQLTVTPAEVTLYLGETGQSFDLTVAVVPTDAVLTYETSNAGVVTVANGKLTAVAVGGATITVTASKEGYDDVQETVAVTVAPIISGDVNLDGEVNTLDIQTAINIAIGRTVPTALQIEAADLNNDGKVNILDVVKIINLVMEA